jgi:hypothetical protein
MANWFLLFHPPDRRNTGKRTDSQAGDVASPRKRKLSEIETKGSDPGRIVSRVAHPSWFCLDGDFGFRSRRAMCEGVNPGGVLAQFVSTGRESYRTAPTQAQETWSLP